MILEEEAIFPWLTTLTVLERIRVQLSAPKSDSSQPPLTEVPEDPIPPGVPDSYIYPPTHTHTYTIKIKKRIIFKTLSLLTWVIFICPTHIEIRRRM